MKYSELRKLIWELALALEIASIRNSDTQPPNTGPAWGVPSPFQDKIDEILDKAGRPSKHETDL